MISAFDCMTFGTWRLLGEALWLFLVSTSCIPFSTTCLMMLIWTCLFRSGFTSWTPSTCCSLWCGTIPDWLWTRLSHWVVSKVYASYFLKRAKCLYMFLLIIFSRWILYLYHCRAGSPDPIKMALVRFSSQIEAMNAFIKKNRGFCLNNQILVRVLQ